MAQLQWFVGVDWGSRTHHVCILDGAGGVRKERAFAHGGAGLAAMVACIADSTANAAAETVGVAIETPRGPVVESLLAHGLAVHSINPKQLDRFRDRHSPAGAKDDRRDAWVLAAALRSDPDAFHQVEATDPLIVELREWSRIAEELKRERVRLSNQMREQLWRYYPQFNETVKDLAKTTPWSGRAAWSALCASRTTSPTVSRSAASKLEEYLAGRRALGTRLEASGRQLERLIAFAGRHQAAFVTTGLALRWATEPRRAQPAQWAKRLGLTWNASWTWRRRAIQDGSAPATGLCCETSNGNGRSMSERRGGRSSASSNARPWKRWRDGRTGRISG